MGIELNLYGRCHECPHFASTDHTISLYGDGKEVIRQTFISCAHKDLCNHLLKYLQEGLKQGKFKEELK